MKNLYLMLIVLFVFPFTGFSQGENDNWVFGDQAAVDFSSVPPVSVTGSQMDSQEGVASISDASGNLLFYTNGRKIWNKNHQIMPYNSTTTYSMTAGSSSIQGVVIVPFLNHPQEYFVFTTNGTSSDPYDFSAFSKIDMSANNGLGEIVSLNTPLLDNNGNAVWNNQAESITVTEISGGYWVLIAYESNILAYRVDSSGVDINPVTSSITPLTSFESAIKISPNQNFLTLSDYQADKFYIYNFDVTTGIVLFGPPYAVFDTFMYSAAFSTQGDVIWMSDYGGFKIYGYEINNLTAPPAVFTVGVPNSFPTTLQRGPDGNIYVSINNSQYLGKISNPNNINTATYNAQAVYLGGNKCRYGLPQLIPPPVCIQDLTLTGHSQPNFDITYEVSQKITTTLDYYALPILSQITMDAGDYIEMLPNTTLESSEHGSILAIIDGCSDSVTSRPAPPIEENYKTKIIYLPKDEMEGALNLEIYPNPANGEVMVSINEGSIKDISIISLKGRTAIEKKAINKESYLLDVSSLMKGLYIVKAETSDGEVITSQLLKE